MTVKPFLKTWRNGLAIGVLALSLSACGSTNWGFPYRADVQQGNWITAEQVARLERGMTRDQVRFVLGTPVLQDVFRNNRWDYTYYNKPGYGEAEERQFTVWFEGDVLVRWAGDQQPDRQPFQASDTGKITKSSNTTTADENAQRESNVTQHSKMQDRPVGPNTDIGINVNRPRPNTTQSSTEPLR